MNWLINTLIKLGLLKEDLDYHLMRASMVVLFLFFGYQEWFEYETQALIPFIGKQDVARASASAAQSNVREGAMTRKGARVE